MTVRFCPDTQSPRLRLYHAASSWIMLTIMLTIMLATGFQAQREPTHMTHESDA